MSAVPKATRSAILKLTVVPESWTSYPTIDRCTIDTVTFENLDSSSHLERSTLNDVTIQCHQRSSHIERSQLTRCTVAGAHIARCQFVNTSITGSGHVDRVEARDTQFVGARHVERSVCEDSAVLGKSGAQRSILNDSVIADSSWVERSELYSTIMTRSRAERSVLKDCDVMNCQIENTNFEGMTLKYGIWRDGDLVGRTCKEEVVIAPRRPQGQRNRNEGERRGTAIGDVSVPLPSEHRPNLAPGRSARIENRFTAQFAPDKTDLPRDGSVSPASLSSRSTVSLVSVDARERELPPSYESLHAEELVKQ